MAVPTDQSRDISLEGVLNVRHLGGYATADGRTTSIDFIRARQLSGLTAAGIEQLRELGVRTVIDLRDLPSQEQMRTPDLAPAGIQRVSAPISFVPYEVDGSWTTTVVAYQLLLEGQMPGFRSAFAAIADSSGALLFHCTGGKDRTGMTAALLLDLAGVDRVEIAADYCRISEVLRSEFPAIEARFRRRGLNAEQIAQVLASNAEDVLATLEYIDERWGSSEGYLAAAGLSESARSAVRARICP